MVTHRAGALRGLAHEHLVVARGYEARLRLDPRALGEASLDVVLQTRELAVDEPADVARWSEALRAAGVVAGEMTTPGRLARWKVRRSMLAADQLDAARHPTILARAEGLERARGADDGVYVTRVGLSVRGRTAHREVRLTVAREADAVTLEGSAPFTFGELGIEPYRALFGTIRVADAFDLFVRLVARRAPAG